VLEKSGSFGAVAEDDDGFGEVFCWGELVEDGRGIGDAERLTWGA
jgi:hypothetical protein